MMSSRMEKGLFVKPGLCNTRSGRVVNVLKPSVDMIHMDDVSISLAKKNRYNDFLEIDIDDNYSVAQHSVYVSRIMSESEAGGWSAALVGWAHDLPEFILQDIPTPIKEHLPDYKALEAAWGPVCYEWAGTTMPDERMHALMKYADHTILMMEMHQFGRWLEESHKYPKLFDFFEGDYCMKPSEARQFFLDEYESIIFQLELELDVAFVAPALKTSRQI